MKCQGTDRAPDECNNTAKGYSPEAALWLCWSCWMLYVSEHQELTGKTEYDLHYKQEAKDG